MLDSVALGVIIGLPSCICLSISAAAFYMWTLKSAERNQQTGYEQQLSSNNSSDRISIPQHSAAIDLGESVRDMVSEVSGSDAKSGTDADTETEDESEARIAKLEVFSPARATVDTTVSGYHSDATIIDMSAATGTASADTVLTGRHSESAVVEMPISNLEPVVVQDVEALEAIAERATISLRAPATLSDFMAMVAQPVDSSSDGSGSDDAHPEPPQGRQVTRVVASSFRPNALAAVAASPIVSTVPSASSVVSLELDSAPTQQELAGRGACPPSRSPSTSTLFVLSGNTLPTSQAALSPTRPISPRHR